RTGCSAGGQGGRRIRRQRAGGSVSAIATHGTRYLAGPVALGTDPLRPLCILRRAESGPETTSQRADVRQLAGTRGFLRFSAGDRACCGRGRRLRAVKALYRTLTA